MKTTLFKGAVVALPLLFGTAVNAQDTYTYNYTGDVQTYTVPAGITSIQIEVWGAQGQALTIEDYDGSTGGLGGYAIGNLTVTPGEVLNVYVGGTGVEGTGGYNGGAVGGYGTPSDGDAGNAGSGGGASDVRQDGDALADRVIVAGGGGGGGRDYVNGSCVPCGTGGNGGAGGGLVGTDGDDPADPIYGVYFNPGSGGSGGTAVAGGAGGDGTEGVDGNPGALGDGGIGVDGNYSVASGGGGGGYYGGGSGAGANAGSGRAGGGGAGGSSYIGGVTDGATTAGIREGDGQIIITELCVGLTTSVSETVICEGEFVTLSAESTMGGTVTWDSPEVTDGVPFMPTGTGVVTYEATSDVDGDCPFVVEITVNAAPEVAATADPASICEGDELTVTATGADEYVWDNGAENGVAYVPAVGTGTIPFTVIGTETVNGCTDTLTIDVAINALPTVVANADAEIYCEGDEITLTGSGADTYTWDMGVEDGVAFTQEIGTETYSVVGVSAEGCENTAEIEVTVVANPTISIETTDELYGEDGTATVTVDSGLAPYTFDWDNDGTGDFDDDQNQTALAGGTYEVTMTDANGCSVTETVVVNSQLSIELSTLTGLAVYPNPTQADLNIQFNGNYLYTLTAVSGEVIFSGASNGTEQLDLNELANGVYLLTVQVNDITEVIKVVKH